MDFINKNLRGILFCFALAVPATYLGKLFPVVGAPVFAILFGLAAAFWKRPAFFQPGIQFTAKKILQYSIILLGFGMNLFEILAVGSQSLLIIVSTIGTALITAYILSRIMNIERDIATLVGVGSSICGGSAIAAAAPVIKASDKDIAQSISVIFLFNVVAAFLFPALGDMLGFTDTGFGMWVAALVVISPEMQQKSVVTRVSQATRELGSWARQASRMLSEIRSATLSGWPVVTHSEVKSLFSIVVLFLSVLSSSFPKAPGTGRLQKKRRSEDSERFAIRTLIFRLTPDLAP